MQAGTTDGPGMFNFVQSTTSPNPFWNAVSHLLAAPTKEEVACHHPKPILINSAGIEFPYPWATSVVPLAILRFGRLFILSVPSELTTMAGRRLREAVAAEVVAQGLAAQPIVVIAGLANDYADYCTTFEEYQVRTLSASLSSVHAVPTVRYLPMSACLLVPLWLQPPPPL